MGKARLVAGRTADPEAFVLRSGARSGHKREFAFCISQVDVLSPRTRSGKSPASPPISPIKPSNGKRRRKSDAPEAVSATPAPPPSEEHESSAKVPIISIPLPSEPLMAVDGDDGAKVDAGRIGEGLAEEISVHTDPQEVPNGEIVLEKEPIGRITWSPLKGTAAPAALVAERPGSVVDMANENKLESTGEDSAVDTLVPSLVCEESMMVEIPVLARDNYGSSSAQPENRCDVQSLDVIGGDDGFKVDSTLLEKPVRRFTRSLLKTTCVDPKNTVAVSPNCQIEKVFFLVDGASGSDIRNILKEEAHGVPNGENDVAPLKVPDVETSMVSGNVPNVDNSMVERSREAVDVVKKPEKAFDVSITFWEKPARRFTRSVLKVSKVEQETSSAEAQHETSMVEVPIMADHEKCDAESCNQKKPGRRSTRPAIKLPAKDPAVPGSSKTSIGSEEVKSGDNVADGSLRTTPKKKMELKMSKKIALTKLPSNVRDLFGTGLLEGFPVKYRIKDKKIGLEGVIKGNEILCYCASCKGSKSFSAYNFELHAGSAKKHPSDFIFLENGNSLRDVLKACTSAPLDMLETVIQNAIGTLPPKCLSICEKCREPFHSSYPRKFGLLCDLCLRMEEPQARPGPSNATSSHASKYVTEQPQATPGPSNGTSSHASKYVTEQPQATPGPSNWTSSHASKLSRTAFVTDSSDSALKNLSTQKKSSLGRLTRKDLGLHKLVFMDDILPEGTEVGYYNRGKRLLDGYIKASGIFCNCCNNVLSPSQFESHAGQASRRKPYNSIYTSNGVSLHELSVSLSKGRKLSACENDDLCRICADGGDLLCCDLCPRSFHKECVGLSGVPEGDWHCQYCQNMHHRDKCVGYNDNAIAAGRVSGVDPIEQIIKRCIRIVTTSVIDIGGCVLCRQHDFSKAMFDDRTVLICDQCEKEYHVGCLKHHNMADLKELPRGEWFCCADCSRIYLALQVFLLRGSEPLLELDAEIIKKKGEEKGLNEDAAVNVRWRLLSGKTSSSSSKSLLREAVSIFRESFDPILEARSGRDLIPLMVNGESAMDQDFGGMYCAVLTVNSSIVSAGILRILGSEVAELPLVATRREIQGKGYFRSLFSCIERLLGSLNVKHFVLPAADEALSIWTKKFGFTKISPDKFQEYTKGVHPMNFHGTSMLYKLVPRVDVSSQGNQ